MAPIVKLLGYAGSASIGGTQVLVTGGSLSDDRSPAYYNMISTPNTGSVSRTFFSEGVAGLTGSVSFDLHSGAMGLLSVGTLFQRSYSFDVILNAGVVGDCWKLSGCKVQNLSVSGSEGGLISAQLSFISANERQSSAAPSTFLRDAEPLGYWDSGTGGIDNVKEWTLTMNQSTALVYKNVSNGSDPEYPAYVKVGAVTYTLDVTLYEDESPTDPNASIVISGSTFTLKGSTTGKRFSLGGVTGLGTYSYTFETSSQNGASNDLVIS